MMNNRMTKTRIRKWARSIRMTMTLVRVVMMTNVDDAAADMVRTLACCEKVLDATRVIVVMAITVIFVGVVVRMNMSMNIRISFSPSISVSKLARILTAASAAAAAAAAAAATT